MPVRKLITSFAICLGLMGCARQLEWAIGSTHQAALSASDLAALCFPNRAACTGYAGEALHVTFSLTDGKHLHGPARVRGANIFLCDADMKRLAADVVEDADAKAVDFQRSIIVPTGRDTGKLFLFDIQATRDAMAKTGAHLCAQLASSLDPFGMTITRSNVVNITLAKQAADQ